jgi:hypothetical protein
VVNNTNVEHISKDINSNFEHDMKMQKLREELSKSFSQYKDTMRMLAADAPIEILCLPSSIQKVLLDSGCSRVYDLFDLDFTKIKGLGPVRIRNLTTSLDQFFSMM